MEWRLYMSDLRDLKMLTKEKEKQEMENLKTLILDRLKSVKRDGESSI